ncbi:exosporium protein C [Paenibacillus sp. CAA11]|uniref:exosporium protein C n=1 Tax=Paenibacillus sp. CAA11 TaxID=1532905 RepID=UPI000D39A872|nr:exosporium protein C [Paenibacillus sp. CAA11]AWB46344.1 exosporium protein C [Paenibacillus sp. CAA11]
MVELLDYATNVPTPVTNGASIPVPITPAGQGISQIRLTVPRSNNRVEIKATVGLQGTSGISRVLFRVFRDTTEISYGLQGIEASFEGFYLVSFQAIDTNAPTGVHDYTISVENLSAGTNARVVGPIQVSGTVYGL